MVMVSLAVFVSHVVIKGFVSVCACPKSARRIAETTRKVLFVDKIIL